MKAKFYFVSTLIIYVVLISNTQAQVGKTQAIDSVTSKMTSQELSDYNVLCYPELIQGNEFNLTAYHVLYSPYDTSWLLFTDMIPMAQWDHDCKYHFVDRQTGNIAEIDAKMPPPDYWYGWEFVNYPYPYPQNNHNNDSMQVYSYGIDPDPHKYAVFLCWNESEACRWNNLSHIFCGIKRNYGFMDENVFVLSGNGTLPDTLSPNLDNEFPINDFDGPCTKDSISDVFDYLSQTLTNEDILFVYGTTHGEKRGQDTSYLRLWNYDSLFDYELAEMLSDIQCSEKIIGLDACYSGGFRDNFEDSHTVIQTCVDGNNVSWIQGSGFHDMTFWWGTALRGCYPSSDISKPWENGPNIGEHDSLYTISSVDSVDFHPDDTLGGNHDGFIQFQEVFNFAHHYAADIKIRNGQNYINEGFQGDLLTLNGIEGRVDTSQRITGDFLIGRKLTLAPGVVLSDSTTFLSPLNLFLNDSTEILVQDSAMLYFNDTFTTITGCIGQSFVTIQGGISDTNMNFEAGSGATINVNFNNESKSYALESFDFKNASINAACDSLSFEKSKFDNSPLEFSGNYLLLTNENDFDSSELVLKSGDVTISQVNDFDYSDFEFAGNSLNITSYNDITNSSLDLSNGDVTIEDYNEFINSTVSLSHPGSGDSYCNIIGNTFDNDASTNAIAVITIEDYANFLIKENDIQYSSKRGIDLYYANAEEVENIAIRNNLIRLNGWDTNQYSELGIHSYYSNALIENNRIDSNDYGIAGFHESKLTILGDSLAKIYDSTQQIHNNHYSQCIFSLSSFPHRFRWNAIGDTTEPDIPYIKAVKYEEIIYDTTGISDWTGDTMQVQYNCWSQDNDTNPESKLVPEGAYEWRPKWCPGDGQGHEKSAAESAFNLAEASVEAENYMTAEEEFKELIFDFPGSVYAQASIKSLFAINQRIYGASYSALRNYCDSLSANPGDSLLGVTAGWLSIHCDIKDELYQQAVNSLDSIITNPPSLEDSIYALIDLGYVYTKIADTTNQKSMLFSTHSDLIPKTYKKYIVQRDIWIEELLKSQNKEKTPSTPFASEEFKGSSAEISSIYPNPTSKSLAVGLEIYEEGTYWIMLFSLTGQKLIQYTESFSAPGTYSIRQDVSMIPSGIYFLVIQSSGAILDSKKLVKSNE